MKINFWTGDGRRLILLPADIINSQVQSNKIINGLYLKGMGYYPNAKNHYTERKQGFSDNILFFCSKGKGSYTISGTKYTVKANQFFILPAHVPHSYEADKQMPWSIYWTHFAGNALAKLNRLPCANACTIPSLAKNAEEIESVFKSILYTLERGFAIDHLIKANMELQQLLSLVLFNHLNIKQEKFTDIHQTIIEKAISLMRENVNGYLSNKSIADKLGYSQVQLYRIFKERTGFSPIDYYINLKIQEASHLLTLSNLKVKDVASKLGYEDVYYFSRLFKKKMGYSPHEYQKKTTNRKILDYSDLY